LSTVPAGHRARSERSSGLPIRDALRRVLTPLSAALQASVLIVRHTSPTVQSFLSSILGRALAMPVKQADTGEQLRVGVVYVAPPNLQAEGDEDAAARLTAVRSIRPIWLIFRT